VALIKQSYAVRASPEAAAATQLHTLKEIISYFFNIMARKRKTVYKRKYKQKRKARRGQVIVSFPTRVGQNMVFPDRLKCVMRCTTNGGLISGTTYETYTLKGNCPIDVGPQINNTTNSPTWVANNPTPLVCLISKNTTAAYTASAPYYYCRVDKSTIRVKFTSAQGNNEQVSILCRPIVHLVQPVPSSLSLVAQSQEQPKTKYLITSATSTSGLSTDLVYTMDTATLYGLPSLLTKDSDYWSNCDSRVCSVPWYWYVEVANSARAGNLEGFVEMVVDYHCEFFGLNSFGATSPA